jgi:Tfp pilus assembly protein FimT
MTAKRRAVTLFELLVVLFILVLIAALAVPTIDYFMPDTKVRAAVDQVRSAWAEAKARAMEEGRPYRFAVVHGSGAYRVAPDSPEFWGENGPGGKENQDHLVLEDSLPTGVQFNVAGGTGGPAQTSNDNSSTDPGRASCPPPSSLSAYSSPIVFLPDGTAREDSKIAFQAKGSRQTTLQLSGATGGTSVETSR